MVRVSLPVCDGRYREPPIICLGISLGFARKWSRILWDLLVPDLFFAIVEFLRGDVTLRW